MGRRPRKRGISVGTVTMLTLTALILLGCSWLFPKLSGQVDFQLNAQELAVAIDASYTALTSNNQKADANPTPANTPLASLPTLQPAATPEPATASFSFTAAGSIAINSAVQKAMTSSSGYQFPLLFEYIQEDLQSDLTVATLENTVIPTSKLTDNNLPTDALTALADAGFSALSLGYYDILNSGIQGLAATKEAMAAAGIVPYGIYATQEERSQMTVTNANGLTVGLLSYQNELSSSGKKKTTKEEQSFAYAQPTLPTVTQDIQALRDAGAQVVVVSLCWGKANATAPTKTQRDLAQGIANAGADIIIGSRSDALQEIALLTAHRADGSQSQTLCAYSLGQLFTANRDKRAAFSSILLHATITQDRASGAVTFDNLCYSPTFVWRGKEEDRTLYRIMPSNIEPPAFMGKDQQDIMNRCLALVQEVMEASGIPMR